MQARTCRNSESIRSDETAVLRIDLSSTFENVEEERNIFLIGTILVEQRTHFQLRESWYQTRLMQGWKAS